MAARAAVPSGVVVSATHSGNTAHATASLRAREELQIPSFFQGHDFGSPEARRMAPDTYLGTSAVQACCVIVDTLA